MLSHIKPVSFEVRKKRFISVRYWLSIIIFGMTIGLSIRLVQAWTNPTVIAPGGNLAGPITTGGSQSKSGGLTLGGAIGTPFLLDANNAGFYIDPNATSMVDTMYSKLLIGNGTNPIQSTASGWAFLGYGPSWSSNSAPMSSIGSGYFNDIYLRSIGKWASQMSSSSSSSSSIPVYACPNRAHGYSCDDGQLVSGFWADTACVGQITSQSTCQIYWYTIFGSQSCTNSCSYKGEILLK